MRSTAHVSVPHRTLLFLASLLLVTPIISASPSQIGSIWERYYDALSLTGEASSDFQHFRTLHLNHWSPRTDDHPWASSDIYRRLDERGGGVELSFLEARAFSSYNSYYPSGGNDFGVWQGAGLNSWTDGGVQLAYKNLLQLTIAPRVFYAQNDRYPMMAPAVGDFGYFVGGIDSPQRYGDEPYYRITPGESEFRVSMEPISVGFGTQSLWFGPARFNPIILGNNGPGFPHVDITLEPWETRFGSVDLTAIWGRLEESEYFDSNPSNDYRFLSALAASYQPLWVPGLTIGVHRTAQSPWSDVNAGSFIDPFTTQMSSDLGKDNKDQRAALTIDWRFPSVGFEAYAEWARNDYSPNWRYIIRAPEHSQAYTIGVRQHIPIRGEGLLLAYGELTQLIHSRDYYIDLGMGRAGFYHHGINRAGHTHRGQILGAPIGTGADSQTIGADWYGKPGFLGLRLTRTARNKDYIYGASNAGRGDIKRMNVEMLYEISGGYFIAPRMLLESSLSFGHTINWLYQEGNDVNNVRAFLGFTFLPGE